MASKPLVPTPQALPKRMDQQFCPSKPSSPRALATCSLLHCVPPQATCLLSTPPPLQMGPGGFQPEVPACAPGYSLSWAGSLWPLRDGDCSLASLRANSGHGVKWDCPSVDQNTLQEGKGYKTLLFGCCVAQSVFCAAADNCQVPKSLYHSYWSKIALQSCVSFCCTMK